MLYIVRMMKSGRIFKIWGKVRQMYTAKELAQQLTKLKINPRGTLLVHSSMKSIGNVEGGAQTVLDVLCSYMKDGLLVFPTHTWAQMNQSYNVFRADSEPSCVGLLSNLFLKRPGVIRSLHPTHSVAALGRDAESFTAGEERTTTPCPRNGCWGKLYDRKATILFIGCTLKSNTFLHGVEEWCNIENRIAKAPQEFIVIAPDGRRFYVPQYLHHTEKPKTEPSDHYDKMEPAFKAGGAVWYGNFGAARCIAADAVKMADITTRYLLKDPHLFDDDRPLNLT